MLNLLDYDPFQNDVDQFERWGEEARFSSCPGCPPKGRLIEEDVERLDYLARHCIPDSKIEARRFLTKLDPDATSFTFQTFDDNAKRKDKTLARILHGTLNQHWKKLCDLNRGGAGVYVTVNETDGKGRTKENITRARSLFVDLDGAPLEPVMQSTPKPHIVVESSPGKFHPYWLVNDCKLEQFEGLQKVLAARFDGDPAVCDLPRVLRLPGFYHRKGEPYRSRIVSLRHSVPAYRVADFDLPAEANAGGKPSTKGRTGKLNDAALRNLAAWVPGLFPNAKPYHGGFRISSADLGRDLEEDLSIVPEGITDFGVADQGDPREGKRTPVELVMEHYLGVPIEDIAERNNHSAFVEACDWLRERVSEDEELSNEGAEQTPRVWPVLAPEALHGLAGEVVRTIEPHTESDPVAILLQFLVYFGNVIKRGPYYKMEGDRHFTNLYAVLVGQSSKSRKGTSAGRVREIMEGVDQEWADARIQSGLSSGEGLIWAIRDEVHGVNKKGESTVEPGVKDKRLLLDEREFSQALTVTKREGNTVSRMVRDAWDSRPLACLTKVAKGECKKPHVSIVGHITRDELRALLDATSMANGYANRFLFVCVRRSKELPHGGDLSAATVDALSKKVREILFPESEPKAEPKKPKSWAGSPKWKEEQIKALEILGAAPRAKCMICGAGKKVLQIKYAGETYEWHQKCAEKYVTDEERAKSFETFGEEHARDGKQITMNAEAHALWSDVYHDLSGERPGMLGAICGRAEAQTLRLALLYTRLDGKDEIEPVHLRAALAVWQYCEDSARYIFGDSVGSAFADELLRVLRESGGMSRNDIHNAFARNKKHEQTSAALDLLRERGLAKKEKRPPKGKAAGGRPIEFWLPI
jgi:DNA primase RepB-like protein